MQTIIRCAKCNKDSFVACEGFDGKALFISLDIQRYYDMCKSCHDIKRLQYQQHFCSVQCLKDWIANDLDKYVEDEVMWGRMYRENPQLKKD
jgi:transcription elongation factor Elf1